MPGDLPFERFLTAVVLVLVFPKVTLLGGHVPITEEEGSLLQLTSLLLPRNPRGAQQLLHPAGSILQI